MGLETRSDAVEDDPLNCLVQLQQRPVGVVSSSASIMYTFEELGSELLILGEPGVGKTTLILELAQQLVTRAEKDANRPIPLCFSSPVGYSSGRDSMNG